jgi:hypothetical protein
MKNFRKITFLLGLMGALVLAAGPAGANNIIGFDNIAPGTTIDGVNLGGVTLNTPGGTTGVVAGDGPEGIGFISPFNAVTNFNPNVIGGNYLTTLDLVLTFDVFQDFVAVVGGDRGGDTDRFTITAYGAAFNFLDTYTTPVFGGNALDTQFMVDNAVAQIIRPIGTNDIKYLVISDAINFGIGIENVTFHNVPIPGSALLMGSGLLGLLGMARRKIWSR